MWYLMIFSNHARSKCVRVMSFATIKDVAYVLDETPVVVSNFFHHLIRPRNKLNYVSLFKH